MPPPQHVMPTMPAFSQTLIQGCIPVAEDFYPFPSTCYLGDCVTTETHSAWHWNTPPSDTGTPSETESSVLGLMGINHLESLMEVRLATRPTTSSSLCTEFVSSDLTSLNAPTIKSITAVLSVWRWLLDPSFHLKLSTSLSKLAAVNLSWCGCVYFTFFLGPGFT